MAALVQTLPPQTATVTMVGRPSSSGGYSSQGPQVQVRGHQANRYSNMAATGYRGMPATGPVAPYAFTSTPQLGHGTMTARQYALSAGRSKSAPLVPQTQAGSSSSSRPASPPGPQKIDAGSRPLSLGLPIIPTTGPLLGSPLPSPPIASSSNKPSPDRYRRIVRRPDGDAGSSRAPAGSALPSGSGMAAVGSLHSNPSQSSSTPSLDSQQSHWNNASASNASTLMNTSVDDLQISRPPSTDLASRYRRRSVGSIETAGLNHTADSHPAPSPHPNAFVSNSMQNLPPATQRPVSHRHSGSSDSAVSSLSTRSSRPGSVSTQS